MSTHGLSMRRKKEIIGKLGFGNLRSVFRGLRGEWGVEGLTENGLAGLFGRLRRVCHSLSPGLRGPRPGRFAFCQTLRSRCRKSSFPCCLWLRIVLKSTVRKGHVISRGGRAVSRAGHAVSRAFRASFLLTAIAALSMAMGQAVLPPRAAPAQPARALPITFGQSVVPLYGPWKFQIGDSPLDPVTHAPLWSEPGYDDSKWETVDLTPRQGTVDPFTRDPRYVPGWTMKGHAGYWGWAWYRIQVSIVAKPGDQLAWQHSDGWMTPTSCSTTVCCWEARANFAGPANRP